MQKPKLGIVLTLIFAHGMVGTLKNKNTFQMCTPSWTMDATEEDQIYRSAICQLMEHEHSLMQSMGDTDILAQKHIQEKYFQLLFPPPSMRALQRAKRTITSHRNIGDPWHHIASELGSNSVILLSDHLQGSKTLGFAEFLFHSSTLAISFFCRWTICGSKLDGVKICYLCLASYFS